MSAHTPGPWVVNGAGGDFRTIAELHPAGVLVSAACVGGDEISNARLIAAAPDLMGIVRTLVNLWKKDQSMAREDNCAWDDYDWSIAEAAIAKAEGR